MTDERRGGTLDNLLVKMGELKAIADNNHGWLNDIKEMMTTQNGRIGKLEAWRAFILGVTAVLVVLVVPVFVRVAAEWLFKVGN